MSGVTFEKDLNAEQLAAVQAPDGPVLVIAAAGTGKTRALTYRVAWLVERGVDTRRILLLTFTNKAAREMLDRAAALVGEAVGGLWGGTFHHMANRILRVHAGELGYGPDYTILDQDDARSLMRACSSELGLLKREFPKPDVLLGVVSYAANTERPVADTAHERFGAHAVNVDDVVRVAAAYAERKRKLNAMDFDDLLVNGLRLFRERAATLEYYQERFLHLLVDEYQDTNAIQAEWVELLAVRRRNLLVVGDDFQSIYSWRGADCRNILTFCERYPDAAVFKLETNYRSVPEILDVANATVDHADLPPAQANLFRRHMRAARSAHAKPVLVHLRDGDAQARYVVDRLAHLARRGFDLGEMAVLYRSHYHAMELQLELSRAQMPYVVTSGMRFFEQAHVKDVCTVVRLWVNPGDELAFLRLMALLPKVGERTAQRVWEKLGRRLEARNEAHLRTVRDGLPEAARAAWRQVTSVWAYDPAERPPSPGAMIARFFDGFYDDYAVNTFENYERRREDVGGLIQFTERYESADAFLSEIALQSSLDAETDDPGGGDKPQIKLSSVHQAKGLEWGAVFILWVVDGMFPSFRAREDENDRAEERRLFYVAATRAKDHLYLCAPKMRRGRDGSSQYFMPSPFIRELPGDAVEEEYLG